MKKGNLLLLMFLVVCWSCQNETEQNPKPETTPIEGETPSNEEPSEYLGRSEYADITDVESLYGVWKLVRVAVLFTAAGSQSSDYSQYNILYEFKPNGILTVSGVPENVESYRDGDYPYSVGNFHDGRSLKIGVSYLWCRMDGNKLEFDTAPLDGPIFKLVKVE